MKITKLKLFFIAYFANLVENIVLLYFYQVPFDKNTFLGAGIFALTALLLTKAFGDGKDE